MADNDQTTAVKTASDRPGLLDRFFEITARGSSIKQEIRGGIVAFVAMAYIVVLNPLILGGSADVEGGNLDFAQLTAVTGLRSEEHTSELQSRGHIVCRLLLEKKKR